MTTAFHSRLLVVDDQPINIQTLYNIFGTDHEVLMATGGEQALALCADPDSRPDLVLLDVLMPGLDGHDVCRKLQENPATRDIPVIFVTAQNDPADEAIGLQLGAVDFIAKPVNAAVVRARVRTQLLLRRTLLDLNELNANLEQRVHERTAELEDAMQRLNQQQEQLAGSEAKATLSTLIASVSHELGTPIGNSVMTASTLTDRVDEFTRWITAGELRRSELKVFMETLSDGTALLRSNLRRASDLLASFKQVAVDQASEQRRTFDLGVVVNEIVHTLRPSIGKLPHRVEVAIPAGIVMDSLPGPIGQVVINLINNAYLHAFDDRTDGVVTLRGSADAEWVRLTVTDNGAGIPAENMERLFDMFFSTKIGRGGSGLGMSIVKNLVEKTLCGELKVSSLVGMGTRFDIRLPRQMADIATGDEH